MSSFKRITKGDQLYLSIDNSRLEVRWEERLSPQESQLEKSEEENDSEEKDSEE